MRVIELDASRWGSFLDLSCALRVALGSPHWHGGGIDAFIDSMVWGGINTLEPPYRICIVNTAGLSTKLKGDIEILSKTLDDARAERRTRRGEDVEVSVVSDVLPEHLKDPTRSGFTMPAPWGPHARSWMAWPCRTEIWRDGLAPAYRAYAQVAKTIARFEPVTMAARPQDAAEARALCGGSVEIWEVPLDDSWARDISPVFVAKPGVVAGVDWEFNAWGGKYRPYSEDRRFAERLLHHQKLDCFGGGMILEGGAIATDGAGTLLTTEECLLNPNRNPHLSRAEIEAKLKAMLGVTRIVWLGRGLVDDETDGHVDNVACFAPDGSVLLAMPGKDDPSYGPMSENKARLKAAAFSVIDVPMPEYRDGLTRSYINFAVTNGGLVIPSFDDPADDEAARIIGAAFPGRLVVEVPANAILVGGGGIHCITYEEPAVP